MMRTFGPVDEGARAQLQDCIGRSGEPDAPAVLCADHHHGYTMPVGGVLALRASVIPEGVGYDIACGNCAVETEALARDVDVPKVMDEIWRVISFGMGRANGERIDDHPVFAAIAESPVVPQRKLLQAARAQLGTVGSGNHYVDLFEDRESGRLWVGVHFGSRGFGHKTASGFNALAEGKAFDEHAREGQGRVLSLATPLGADYLLGMEICGRYAYAGRDWVVDRIVNGILRVPTRQRIHNHHNYAWRETHGGTDYVVIRKGATPAFPGQRGFVGGTMGEDAVILEGVESAASAEALYSTVHGAGRAMSRTEAAGKQRWTKARWTCGNHRQCDYTAPAAAHERAADGALPKCPACGGKLQRSRAQMTRVSDGKVDWPAWQLEVKARGVELRGAGADEAPQCYKRLDEVLAHHAGTVRVLHRLRPVGVAMAGADVEDPFRD